MAAALTSAPTRANVGDNIVVNGTGFALTTAMTATISNPEGDEHTWTTTSSGAGAFTFPGTFRPRMPGIYNVSVTDGSSTVAYNVQVYAG